jgi:spermidine synthase
MSVWDNVKLPKVLYQVSSPYNGNVEVWQVGETYKLVADGTVQSINWNSPSVSRMVFGRMAQTLKEQEPGAKKILVFGLAGGAVQHLIAKEFPDAEIVSVDIDPVMVEIAKNYFDIDSIPNHRIITEDACRVVVEPDEFDLEREYFDAVIVDIYCGQVYPDLGDSGNFLSSLKKLLRAGGLLIVNRIYLEDHQDEVNQFITDLSRFFNDIETVTIAGKTNSDNILIYGRK